MVQNNQVEYDNLNPLSKRLFNDLPLIESRQVSVDKYLYSTDEEAKAELDRLDIENKNLEIQVKKSAAIKPEFSDKESALASIKDRDQVGAKIVPFKDGFNVSMEFKQNFPTVCNHLKVLTMYIVMVDIYIKVLPIKMVKQL